MTKVMTALTPAQVEILQRCSKDSQAYYELLALFESAATSPDPLLTSHAALLPNVLPDPFFLYDVPHNHIVYYNRPFETLMGGPEQIALGDATSIFSLIHPDDVPRVRFLLNDLQQAADGTVFSFTTRIRVEKGFRELLCRSMVISRTAQGDVQLIAGYIEERADLHDMIRISHENQIRFLRLAESLPDTVFIFDVRTRRVLYENRPFFLGYTIEEIVNRELMGQMTHTEDRPHLRDYWQAIYSAELHPADLPPSFEIEFQLLSKSGVWEWVNQRASMITANPQGTPEQLLITLSVITERKQTEQALIASELQYRELLNIIPLGISIADAKTLELLIWNPAFDTLLAQNPSAGYSYEEWQKTVTPEQQAIAAARVATLRSGEPVPPHEYEMTYPNGEVHHIHAQPICIQFEQRPAIMTITQDVTPQKSMEAALRESEQRYRILSEITMDYAFQLQVHPDGRPETVWLAGRFEEITGFTAQESLARGGWISMAHPDDLPRLHDQMRRLTAAPTTVSIEYRVMSKHGGIRHIWGNAISTADPTTGRVTQIFGIGQDITERTHMQNALVERERFIHKITDTMPVMIMVQDIQNGQNVWVNQYASDYVDQPNELNSPRLMHLDPSNFHPDDVARVSEFLETLRHCEDGRVYEMEVRLRRYDGVYRWFNNRAVVFERDASGAVKSLINVLLDINDQKEAQQTLLEKQRLEVEYRKEHELNQLKNKMMQRISHEFRTPLAVIMSSSYVLQRPDTNISEERRRRHFNAIQAQITRVVTMLEDIQFIIYDESQMHPLTLIPTYLQPILEQVIEKAQAVHSDPREVQLHLSPTAQRLVRVDEHLLKMMMNNLISNALKFSGDHTPVMVEGLVDGDWLELRVRDAGIGVPNEDIPHIFEPFYRANNFDEKPGLGLGLTIVKNAIALYGGSISVENLAGGGSLFTVRLPQHRTNGEN